MKVVKVVNNNLVQSEDKSGNEVLVMGCGLGFKKAKGDEIDDSKIEKIYTYKEEGHLEKLRTILQETPLEYVQAVNEIINYARFALSKKLDDNIYLTLTDHINFAVKRAEQGLDIKNALLWEIKHFYNHEFLVGKEALSIIERRLGVKLSEDEAGFIAFHLVNASMDSMEMGNMAEMTKMIQGMVSIVKYHFGIDMDEYSIHYERFITHLKFLASRVLTGVELQDDDMAFLQVLKDQYQEEYKCALKIRDYIQKEYGKDLTRDELIYITVHIKRVTM